MSQSLIGAVRVNLGLDSAQFTQGMQRAKKTTTDFQNVMGKLKGALAGLGVALSLNAFRSMISNTMQTIDAQAKLARGLGGTTAAVQSLERAASRAGVAQSELMAAATRLNQRLGEAIVTGRGTEGVFRRIGVSAQELARMDVDERFAAISDAMRRAGMSTQEMAFYLRELGIRQSSVITLMQEGGDAIRRSREAVNDFGVALTNIQSGAIEAANDSISDMGRLWEGIRNQLAVALAPTIQAVADSITEAGRETRGFQNAIHATVTAGLRAFGFLADAFRGWELIFAHLRSLAAEFVAFLARLIQGARRMIADFVDSVIDHVNGAIRAFNGLGASVAEVGRLADSNFLRSAAEEVMRTGLAAQEAATAFDDLRRAPMPSEGVERIIAQMEHLRTAADDTARGVGQSFDFAMEGVERGGGRAASAVNRLMEEGRRVFEATRTPAERLAMELERLGTLLQAGAIDWDTYSRAVRQAQDAFDQANAQGNNLAQTLSGQFSSMFQGLISGTMSARDAIRNLLQSLAQLLINRAFQALLGGMFGGGGGGILGGLFGGFRAAGGPVNAGRAYIVGERGPEMIVPNRSGTVIPNHELRNSSAGGTQVSVVNNITVEGGGSASAPDQQQALARAIGDVVEARVKQVVLNESRVGGAFNPAF
jgi:hypothetical protein